MPAPISITPPLYPEAAELDPTGPYALPALSARVAPIAASVGSAPAGADGMPDAGTIAALQRRAVEARA